MGDFIADLVIAAAYRAARSGRAWQATIFLIGLPDEVWVAWDMRLGGTAGVPLGALS